MKKSNSNRHIALFYDTDEQRIGFLADYYRQGFDNHQLCVFVTKQPIDKAKAALQRAGLRDVYQRVASGDLRIFDVASTYFGGGTFSRSYMLRNVEQFMEEALASGYQGLRTAGEMNWLDDHAESTEDCYRYEADINTILKDSNFTGLCLYNTNVLPRQVIKNSLLSHPEFAYKQALHHNPLYADNAILVEGGSQGSKHDIASAYNAISSLVTI